ncbi:MAG TPA: hypothetical protein GXX46_05790 [Peptococcaceae bacterium]|nr:hypothetical protein [Peptococcaceae bacterium]
MKKMIAPIIVTVIVLFFLLFYLGVLVMSVGESLGTPIVAFLSLLIFITLGVMIAMVYILFQRLKEIKEEDTDDLSKY